MRGSIVKRGKKYSIVVQIEDEKGEKKQKWISGYFTKREAENDLPRVLTEIQGGVFVDKKIGFSDFSKKWLTHVKNSKKNRLSDSTYTTYEWVMNAAQERFKSAPITSIKPLAVQDYIDQIKLSSTSMIYHYKILKMAFEKAKEWQLLTNNPCDNVTPPDRVKRKFKPYSEEQIKTLLKGAEKSHLYIPILIAITCGLRRGEICSLDWSDIDFERKTIYIRDGKTDNSARAIIAPDKTISELKARRGIGKVVALQPDYVYKSFVKLLEDLKLPAITFHDLRHLHCSLLLMNGIPVKVVSARLGHSSSGFTLDTYAHLLPNMQEQAATKIEEIFNPVSNPLANKKSSPLKAT